jgi:hypothetical protein
MRVCMCADVTFGSGDNFYAGESRDISFGGLFLSIDPEGPDMTPNLETGAHISVRLRVLDDPFNVPCEIVWRMLDDDGRVIGLGVRFLDLTDRLRECIRTFMDLRAPFEFEVNEPLEASALPPDASASAASVPPAE